MGVIDILFRVDEICKKYDKYDIDKQRDLNTYGNDAFAHLYASVESDIEAALQVSCFFLIFFHFCYFSLVDRKSHENEVITLYSTDILIEIYSSDFVQICADVSRIKALEIAFFFKKKKFQF